MKQINLFIYRRSLAAFMSLAFASVSSPALSSPPAAAVGVGYETNTFSSNFTQETVDTKATKQSGFLWYNWDLFGYKSDPDAIELNPDGSVTILGDKTGAHGKLVSAVQYRATNSFVGVAFGGGAYIEAELKFDPYGILRKDRKGWPAFWSLPLEGNVLPGKFQWEGQPKGFVHSIEADFFEDIGSGPGSVLHSYGASLHDWYGIYDKTCSPGLCQVGMPYKDGLRVVPEGTNFNQYHKYGFLWVPATPTSNGYARFYFDGVQVGPEQKWIQFTNQPPPPTGQPWAFGILDQQHIFLILGTSVGQPMTVKSVNVWQKSDQSNLRK